MLLAIDIGNTNINLGLFKGQRLLQRYIIPTQARLYLSRIRKIFSKNKIKDVIICSVVPAATRKIEKDLKMLGIRPKIIGRDIKAPVKNLYRKPKQVGSDRLVNVYAGILLYGVPLVVVDFGTAITLDAVSGKREYLGGMILPGLKISLDCLAERAALLPKIRLVPPRELIGTDTRSSMLSGIVYGFAALCDVLINRLKKKIGKKARVVGTGGNIGLMGRYCRKIERIDKDLTLKGLNLVYINRGGR